MKTILIVLAVAYLVACVPLGIALLRSYLRFRGQRVVVCPETKAPAGVQVDAARAAITDTFDAARLRLESCSRWPERAGCGQECLEQIESTQHGCLVRTMLAEWYADARCAICSREIPEIRWYDHKPAFLDPTGRTLEWREIAAADLPRILATHERVCWDCHVAQTFRRRFPDLVVDDARPAGRPAGKKTHSAA